jgi:hypothetical protein
MKYIPKFQKSGEIKKLNFNFIPNQYNPELKKAIATKKTYPRTIDDLPLKNGTREDAIRYSRMASGGLE